MNTVLKEKYEGMKKKTKEKLKPKNGAERQQGQGWDAYYDCTKRKHEEGGPDDILYPTVLLILEGTSAKLNCDICISPMEPQGNNSVEWYFAGNFNNSSEELLNYNEHVKLTSQQRDLTIYDVQLHQSGKYWCKYTETIGEPYFVQVDNGTEPVQTVHPDSAPNAKHAEPPVYVAEYNLKIYTEWKEWSSCSTCDKVGKKRRYGYCTISLDSPQHKSQIQRAESEMMETDEEENGEDVPAKRSGRTPYDEQLASTITTVLPEFKGRKLPCRSMYTPDVIEDMEEVKNRKSEIMIRYCKNKCPKNKIFEIRNKLGKVIESANNSAGIFSFIQGIPDQPPEVGRDIFYYKHKERAELKCPGNLNSDTPVVWKVRNKLIVPAVLREQSKGKVFVNSHANLVFESLKFADSNIYSCWQNDKLAGTIRLVVTGEERMMFNQRVFLAGATIIVLVFLRIFWKAFKGRNRFTKH